MAEKDSEAPVEEPVQEPETSQEENKPVQKSSFPTLVDFLVFFGIFLLSQVVAVVVALIAGMSWPDLKLLASDDETVRTAEQIVLAHFNALTYFVAMAVTLGGFLFYRSQRKGPRVIAHFSARGFDPVLLLWGVFFVIAASLLLEPLMKLLPEVPNIYGRGVWSLLTLVVMAPVFEEVIFRGVILESARAKYGVVAAWLISSLIFGIVHLYPAVVLNAFVMGLILGFIYIKSGSLWPSIILHAINNALAYLLLAMGRQDMMLTDMIGSVTGYVAVYCVCAVVFAFSGYMVWRTLSRMSREEKKPVEG